MLERTLLQPSFPSPVSISPVESIEWLDAVVDLAPVALAGFDADLVCTGGNRRFAQLAGRRPGGLVGDTWPDLLPDLGAGGDRLVATVLGGQHADLTVRLSDRVWRLRAYPLGTGSRGPGFGVFGEDVTADVERLTELTRLASVDGLTGLLNRSAFYARLQDVAATADRSRPATLLVADLDGFKQVNDRYGHPAGDTLLAEVGARLQSLLTMDDVAGRVGGDEFAVLAHIGGQRAAALAARMVRSLEAPFALGDRGIVHITAAVGHAGIDGSGTAAQAFAAADAHMYARKRAQRRLEPNRPDVLDLDAPTPGTDVVDPVLDRACGLIMGRSGCSERQALAALARIARATRRSLYKVAADLDAEANRPSWQRLTPAERA